MMTIMMVTENSEYDRDADVNHDDDDGLTDDDDIKHKGDDK